MTALALALMLAACSVSTPSDKGPVLRLPDGRLLKECNKPVALPDYALSPNQVEAYWMQDRAALLACGWNKKAIQDFYRNRDNLLRN